MLYIYPYELPLNFIVLDKPNCRGRAKSKKVLRMRKQTKNKKAGKK